LTLGALAGAWLVVVEIGGADDGSLGAAVVAGASAVPEVTGCAGGSGWSAVSWRPQPAKATATRITVNVFVVTARGAFSKTT
jgi:hypothetical protein